MPFTNGKFYMNPAYGRALERERLRHVGAKDTEAETVAAREVTGGHWVTINHRHVFVREGARANLDRRTQFCGSGKSVAERFIGWTGSRLAERRYRA